MKPKYYIDKHGKHQGPFTKDEVIRFVEIGRVKATDLVSVNRCVDWFGLFNFCELIPESMLNLPEPIQ